MAAEKWNARYEEYKDLFKGQRFPLAFVDLDRFDRNVDYVAATQASTGKTIRVASKSIRCVDLLHRIFERGGSAFKGILAFTMEEAGFLIEQGFDDLVVAYPSVQPRDLALFIHHSQRGARLSLVVDSTAHLNILSRAAVHAGVTLAVCLEGDMSYRPMACVHLGVRRSPAHSPQAVAALARHAQGLANLKVVGLMGYEAQIASVNDKLPGQGLKNRLIRGIKRLSQKELARRRQKMVQEVEASGARLSFVNGGGSGSLVSTGKDKSVTEVTAGSAFFAPGLFRHFHEVSFEPSAFFGLQVVRLPKPGMVTCLGGGYVGSGEAGVSRLPWPIMPHGLSYLPMEGAGEVQTPMVLPRNCPDLALGDPVFFQHAKAGELCERFNRLHLVAKGALAGSALTYRGAGKAFL